MKETKIYLFLSSLTAVQLNRLTRYLESPYFNRNEKLLKIYYRLEALIREGAELDVSKKKFGNLYIQMKIIMTKNSENIVQNFWT